MSWWGMASTQAQRVLLKALGVENVRGLTRGQASDMIDGLRDGPPMRCWLDAEMDRYIALPYTRAGKKMPRPLSWLGGGAWPVRSRPWWHTIVVVRGPGSA